VTKKQVHQNRLLVLFQQLKVIEIYPESFHEKLGIKGTELFVDEILDEINYHRQELKKLENE